MSLQHCQKCGGRWAIEGKGLCQKCLTEEREATSKIRADKREREAMKRQEMRESGYLEQSPYSKTNEAPYPLDAGYDGRSGEDELVDAIQRGEDRDEFTDDDD